MRPSRASCRRERPRVARCQGRRSTKNGSQGTQFFSIEVDEFDAVPPILSTPVTTAIQHAHYMYDVDAADIGEREVLTYQLVQSPAGTGIDMVTGRIEWQPDALGSYPVHVQVTDSQGNTHDQSFVLEVVPDTSAPTLDVQFSAQVVAPGQPITLTALASDEVGVASMVVTIDGAVVTLDASGQLQWSSDVPGAHVLVVTAVDSSGNQTQQSWTFGVSDAADNTAPSVSITAPTE